MRDTTGAAMLPAERRAMMKKAEGGKVPRCRCTVAASRHTQKGLDTAETNCPALPHVKASHRTVPAARPARQLIGQMITRHQATQRRRCRRQATLAPRRRQLIANEGPGFAAPSLPSAIGHEEDPALSHEPGSDGAAGLAVQEIWRASMVEEHGLERAVAWGLEELAAEREITAAEVHDLWLCRLSLHTTGRCNASQRDQPITSAALARRFNAPW
jgi:hypothetical protein